jgi:hypothetical protein
MMNIKGLILSDYKGPIKVKKALLDLINEIDNDLNVGGYEQSSDVDKAVDNLDQSLIEVDMENEEEIVEKKVDEDDEVDKGYREIEDDDDDEE